MTGAPERGRTAGGAGVRAARAVVVTAVAALALGACETGTALPPLPPAQVPAVPDLRGTWSGTWGGTPLTLTILEQDTRLHGGGVYVGSWPVAGDYRPAVTGIATVVTGAAGAAGPMSMHMQGWFGAGPAVRVEIRNPYGPQELVLRLEGERLVGSGRSGFPWGPSGPVELSRAAGSRPS